MDKLSPNILLGSHKRDLGYNLNQLQLRILSTISHPFYLQMYFHIRFCREGRLAHQEPIVSGMNVVSMICTRRGVQSLCSTLPLLLLREHAKSWEQVAQVCTKIFKVSPSYFLLLSVLRKFHTRHQLTCVTMLA